MLTTLSSAAIRGVDAFIVRVEVSLTSGLPTFAVVGLPEGAVREGRERVTAALRQVGLKVPPKRITVNLAPADVRKEGSAFDLPIAVGLAAAMEALEPERLRDTALVGELGLDGTLRPVRGAVALAAVCRAAGVRRLLLPAANAPEAAVVDGLAVLGADDLESVLAYLRSGSGLERTRVDPAAALRSETWSGADLRDVRGQEHAKRALEIAAAGGHNLAMTGPPGSGKTMLARRLPGILPPLELEEALEVTRVHSVAGLLPPGQAIVPRRPFRAPHHTVSRAGLVGGGNPPRPGEASVAHRGVLFLDELPEFRRHVLEVLRQPMEDGRIVLARARYTVRYPARFILVAAMNPCPCGYFGDGSDRCTCDPGRVARYRSRVSGPLLDRIDLRIEVPAVPPERLEGRPAGESSECVRPRILEARGRQRRRLRDMPGAFCNARMGPATLRRHLDPVEGATDLLRRAQRSLGLSARGYHRVLRVARTIADLGGAERVSRAHLAEALQYRGS